MGTHDEGYGGGVLVNPSVVIYAAESSLFLTAMGRERDQESANCWRPCCRRVALVGVVTLCSSERRNWETEAEGLRFAICQGHLMISIAYGGVDIGNER